MGRRKGSKNKIKFEKKIITHVPLNLNGVCNCVSPMLAPVIVKPPYCGFCIRCNNLLKTDVDHISNKDVKLKSVWQQLKEAEFPQGGVGNWLQGENDRYYIPSPSEIYQHFIADPAGWEDMSKAMATVWLNRKK